MHELLNPNSFQLIHSKLNISGNRGLVMHELLNPSNFQLIHSKLNISGNKGVYSWYCSKALNEHGTLSMGSKVEFHNFHIHGARVIEF
jgi:hypothetical protein